MSLTPAQDQIDAQRKKDAIEKCGKNGGPHNYQPIEWFYMDDQEKPQIRYKRVKRFMCMTCFVTVSTHCLVNNYPDVSYSGTSNKPE